MESARGGGGSSGDSLWVFYRHAAFARSGIPYDPNLIQPANEKALLAFQDR